MLFRLLAGLTLVCVSHIGPGALAQTFPEKPVRLVIPFAPGGAADLIGRSYALRLSQVLNQQVVPDNRPGAGTNIAMELVARAPADGYTLIFTEASSFAINPHLYKKMPIDPLTDLAPVVLVTTLSPVLVVSSSLPVKTVPELITLLKASPGKYSYASAGNGTYPHIAFEYFKQAAGVDILHVPYKGSGPALTDLIAGRVAFYMATLGVMQAYEKDGKLRVLAAATEKRLGLRPDLPTIRETLPGYAISGWFGVAGPAATPPFILDQLHAASMKAIADPEFKDLLFKQAVEPGALTRTQFASTIRAEHAHWQRLVKVSGAQVD